MWYSWPLGTCKRFRLYGGGHHNHCEMYLIQESFLYPRLFEEKKPTTKCIILMPILPSTKILKFTEKKMYEISQNIFYAPRKTICIIILMSMKLSILKVTASDSDIFYIFAFLDSPGPSCFSDRCSDWAILQFDCLVDSIHMFLSTDWNSSSCSCVQGNDVILCYLNSEIKFIGCFVGS